MSSNMKGIVKTDFFVLILVGMVLIHCSSPTDDATIDLMSGFQNPPESAKPRVWWHWMNGNISREGIKADLEWMKRVGIGGFQNFDADQATPQVVKKRLLYMSPEWKDAFLYATKLADSLGLEMAIAASPGWSESGGPWVPPSQAMKKLVWSEIRIEGGKQFIGTLPKPPAITGRFQNIPDVKGLESRDRSLSPLPEYYADAAIIAYRTPENDLPLPELKPVVSSSSGNFDLSTLTDGDLAKSTFLLAAEENEKAWIQFEFTKSETIHSLTIVCNEGSLRLPGFGRPGFRKSLEASNDGRQFKTIFEIYGGESSQNTYTFSPFSAKYFRITFETPELQDGKDLIELFGGLIPKRSVIPAGIRVAEIVLHLVPRVNRFEDKAGFSIASGLDMLATRSIPETDAIKKAEIIDLTSKTSPNGTLKWTPPPGCWVVLRIGYSLTGQENGPASPEATGLEVDKLNSGYVRAYFNNYLKQYRSATGGLMGKRGLKYVVNDSWEAGVQNWTDNMITEFSKRRSYDMLLWMPVLTGRIVENSEASDRFLWDFRKTISDLTAENHYDQMTTILHKHRMGRYTESHEGSRGFIADGMEVKRKADIPMGAMWTPENEKEGLALWHKTDIRESASVAHIYGQKVVAAESMTASSNAYAYSPERLKPTADMILAMGANRFVIHASVHQPVSDKIPGIGLGRFGQWFTRHETWAEQAKPWMTYLARSSFMLQQGTIIADIVYYYGEDSNITELLGDKLPDIPEGFNYDFVNSDAILNVLSVKNGKIVTPSGMSYCLLALDPNSRRMPLPVLLKIQSLVEDGAIVVGPKPIDTPSLSDNKDEYQNILKHLWITENEKNKFGKGIVYSGLTVAEVLTDLQILPDFEYTKPKENSNLLYVHRKLPGADIYWVNNRNEYVENLEAIFRVEGKVPEIWHPEKGNLEQVSYFILNGCTKVPLHLEPNDAIFVVFCKKAYEPSKTMPQLIEKKITTLDGIWEVNFQSGRGAPKQIMLDTLTSWSDNSDTGVKYFSGTGIYKKTIQAPDNWFTKDQQLWIDLGNVKNIAEVLLNGKSLGIVWKRPFRVDITNYLNPDLNKLEIEVTNLWVNRLIGDQQQDNTIRYTYTTRIYYEATSPLLPSGLLGPVEIFSLSRR